jgi:hypothetical protein
MTRTTPGEAAVRPRIFVLLPLFGCGPEREGAPPDRDEDGYRVPDDCDDYDRYVNPAAVETCDGYDNDCDGIVDVDATDMSTFYADADSDGFGSGASIEACAAPNGTVVNADDCDDTNGEVHFGAVEVCADGLDNDCDGEAPGCDWVGLIHASDASEAIRAETGELHLGTSVAGAGDMNGDGVDDLAVGTNQGLGFVFLGPVTSTSTASASATFEATGDSTFGWFQGGADVDGDGYDDLLGQSQGTLYVIGGPVTGSMKPAEAATATLVGDPYTYFGYSPALGDLNGDAIPDVVVGAPFNDGERGVSYVFYGPVTMGELGAADADAALVGARESYFNGEFTEFGTMWGGANDADGDVNGDGIDDLLVGSWNEYEAPLLFYGPIVGSIHDADVIVHTKIGSSYLGLSSSIGGDLDGDGRHDLAIAAPYAQKDHRGAVYVFYAESMVEVSDLDDLGADATMRGGPDAELGLPVETAGDFDADGIDDLVTIGSDVIGFYGPVWGDLDVEDASFRVVASNRVYGWTTFVGDVSGDGADDLAIGRPHDGVDGLSSVYLFYDGFL